MFKNFFIGMLMVAATSLDAKSSSSSGCCKKVIECTDFQNATPVKTKIKKTHEVLDLAICCTGYFQIQLPSGVIAYTRVGNFHIDSNNFVVNPQGYQLLPQIFVPPGSTNLQISFTGEVYVINGGIRSQIAQILLAQFANPQGLKYIGNGLYVPTVNSGTPVIGIPGQIGLGTIRQGCLLVSNVNSQSRIYTDVSDRVVTNPGDPSAFNGNELNPLNNDGNLGDGHNVYGNVALCQDYPTTFAFIGAGFGGSPSLTPYNYGQILVRVLVPEEDCRDINEIDVKTYLGMSGYDGTYPPTGVLAILVWNVFSNNWEIAYSDQTFPIQALPQIDYAVSLQKVSLKLISACDYIDSDGFINFFIYTPYSGTISDQKNPAQIDMGCFTLCTHACEESEW